MLCTRNADCLQRVRCRLADRLLRVDRAVFHLCAIHTGEHTVLRGGEKRGKSCSLTRNQGEFSLCRIAALIRNRRIRARQCFVLREQNQVGLRHCKLHRALPRREAYIRNISRRDTPRGERSPRRIHRRRR